ncbi:conserved Plasmodium protein, unknown function, partial [Plasmodium ovale curtisi]
PSLDLPNLFNLSDDDEDNTDYDIIAKNNENALNAKNDNVEDNEDPDEGTSKDNQYQLNKAFCKVQALKKEVELKKEDSTNEMKTDSICENITENETLGQYINEKYNEINNDTKKDDHDKEIKKVANESINFLKNLMKNQKAYNKIKNSFREKVFTIDICLDICIINSTFLLTIETSKIVNTRTVNFVKTYAILMNCIHYHNQISNTHELKNSIDIELYPLTILLITNNLNNKYIKPEINVLYILTSSEKKHNYEKYRKTFLFDMENFAFLKKYNILKRKKE